MGGKGKGKADNGNGNQQQGDNTPLDVGVRI